MQSKRHNLPLSAFSTTIRGLKPISINAAWQGRRFRTEAYKQFKKDFCRLIRKTEAVEGVDLEVALRIGLEKKSYARSDIDNFLKPICDAIVEAGIIKDDRYIKKLTVEKYLDTKYSITITIQTL